MNVLLDTCIIMDFLQNREPFAQSAKKIMQAANFSQALSQQNLRQIFTTLHTGVHIVTRKPEQN